MLKKLENEKFVSSAPPQVVEMERKKKADAEAKIRVGVLCLLYGKRRANPDFAALSMLDLERLMDFPREHLRFAIWYLKAKKYIAQDDRSSFIITAEGVEFLEERLPGNELMERIFRASETGLMVYSKALLNTKDR